MTLTTGTRLGPYEITAPLGAGGMGEVYRAQDTKLGRGVAIKVLREAFAADPDRMARFEREARTLAALNHPNIAVIHGVEEASGVRALVMELVDGETLAERIARGSESQPAAGAAGKGVPVAEALDIARQIAEALSAAHEQGIIHRDLKPANIKVREDGTVKVLDFGLAKALAPAGPGGAADSPEALTQSPTLSLAATQAGVILGTAAYMAPEQARGKPADRRSDIWAFGCVLYEMITGARPFAGEDASETLAFVMARDPDFSILPADVPPAIRMLLRRCLEKDRRKRLPDISAALVLIEEAPSLAESAAVPASDSRHVAAASPLSRRAAPWRRALPYVLTALAAAALAIAAGARLGPEAVPAPVVRFAFAPFDGQLFTGSRRVIAISPDGDAIAYSVGQKLYLRSLSQMEERPVFVSAGSNVYDLAFSPDGESIVFWSDGAIRRISTAGGVAETLCTTTVTWGIVWTPSGIFFGLPADGIMHVPANGGAQERIVALEPGEEAYGPQLLPGGDTILFTLASGAGAGMDRWQTAQIVAYSVRTGTRRTLLKGANDARYLPPGRILYAVEGVVFAAPFDPDTVEVTGLPVQVLIGVRRGLSTPAAQFSVSDTGSLIYVPGPGSGFSGSTDLALTDRRGDVEMLGLPPGTYEFPRASPDGRSIAFGGAAGPQAAVWIYEVSGGSAMRRLTFGGNDRYPIWSADGRRITFQSDRDGAPAIYWQPADGTGGAERLTTPQTGEAHIPESWSPDGQTLLFSVAAGGQMSLWTYSPSDRQSSPFGRVQSTTQIAAVFSPDGRWVAYTSNESAGEESIYVEPFPPTGARYQIPTTTGAPHHPLWSRDGKELFYIPGPGRMDVVGVVTRPAFAFGNPIAVPRRIPSAPNSTPRTFDIMPDGRIVAVLEAQQDAAGPTAPQIQVVLNWLEELKARTGR